MDLTKVNNNSVFIITDKKNYSYSEFLQKVKNYTSYLNKIGITPESRCAILSNNSPEYIILLFAIWNCKATAVPLNIRLTDNEINNQLEHGSCNFIFLEEEIERKLSDNIKRISFSEIPGYLQPETDVEFDTEKTSLIIYTSGTSGNPKGIMHSLANLLSSAKSADMILQHNINDRWLASLPFYHVGGISIPIRAFLNNVSVIIPASLKTEDIISSMRKHKPTLISFVPTVLKRIIEQNIYPGKELKYVLLGGGPSEDELILQAIKLGWKIIKVYGSTETASMVTAFVVNDNPTKMKSSGFPLGGNEIQILNDNKPAPANVSGLICVKGKSVFKGYWNSTLEMSNFFKDDYFITGDYGYIDKDGYLYVEARRNDLIISGGENINPIEIEDALHKLDAIKEACVFGIPDQEWGQVPAAAIVLRKLLKEEEIIDLLKDQLASYKIPKRIFILNELPKTELGKIIRDKVRKSLLAKFTQAKIFLLH